MNKLVYLLLATIFLTGFFEPWLPRVFSLAPEVVSGVILLAVITRLIGGAPLHVHPKYLVWFGGMLLLIIAGLVLNDVQAGAIFWGIRKYFRYAPVFLLPLVYPFSDAEIKGQLRLLIGLVLIQLPVTIYQRVFVFPYMPTGDVVGGTIVGSGSLSVYLLCALSFLTAFYAKGRITLGRYLLLALLFFLPTTINETTATLILFPVAIVAPFLLMRGGAGRLRKLLPIGVVGALLLGAFIVTYNAQFADRWGGSVLNVFTGDTLHHVYRGATAESRADGGRSMSEINRVDSMIMPFLLQDDVTKLALGVGMGNASKAFHPLFAGDYNAANEMYGIDFTTYGQLLWELGIAGVLLSLAFLAFVFFDARRLADRDDLQGAVGLGWQSVMVLMVAALAYTSLLTHNTLGFSMWLFFGHIVALRQRETLAAHVLAAPRIRIVGRFESPAG